MQTSTNATARITAISGFTLMPLVSSSKNLNKPALWAGMGDLLSRFFSLLLLMVVASLALFYTFRVLLIKVVLSFICLLFLYIGGGGYLYLNIIRYRIYQISNRLEKVKGDVAKLRKG